MDEAVLVPNLQARYPPVLHVGLVAVRHVDVAPGAELAFIAMVEILETVEVVEIPGYRSVFSVDFKGVQSLVASRISGGFKGG